MKITIRNSNDFVAGIIFIFFWNNPFVYVSRVLNGNCNSDGTRLFSFNLGGILLLLGIAISLRAWGARRNLEIMGISTDYLYPWLCFGFCLLA